MAMIRKSTSELSIKPKMSSQMRMVITFVSLLVLIAALAFTYRAGVSAGHAKVVEDRATINRLSESITGLQSQLDKSGEDLIIAQRHQQIQEEAYEQINAAYASSEKKNSYLGSRLDFYRSIISPQDGNSGPAIQAADLTLSDQGLGFSITLVQAIKHKHQVRGTLEVSLIDAGETVAVWPQGNPRSVNYQYFEQISGAFEGVEVSENAKINVNLSLQGGEQLVREFKLGLLANK